MKLNRFFILMLLSLLCSTASSQSLEANDTIHNRAEAIGPRELPTLPLSAYLETNSMDRSYNYKLLNKKRKLLRMSKDVETFSYLCGLGAMLGVFAIADDKNWSEWIITPCGMIGFFAVTIPLNMWSKNLEKKANAIDVSTAYILPIDKSFSVGVSHFRNKNDYAHSIGIGIKKTF